MCKFVDTSEIVKQILTQPCGHSRPRLEQPPAADHKTEDTHTHTHTFTPLPSTSLLPCQSRLITARIWPSRWANLPCYAAPLKSSVPPSPRRELQDRGGEREGKREGCRGRTPPPFPTPFVRETEEAVQHDVCSVTTQSGTGH